MKNLFGFLLACFVIIFCLQSCSKSHPSPNPYSTDSGAINALTSLYSEMAAAGLNANLSVLAGLSADELSPYPGGSKT